MTMTSVASSTNTTSTTMNLLIRSFTKAASPNVGQLPPSGKKKLNFRIDRSIGVLPHLRSSSGESRGDEHQDRNFGREVYLV